MSILKKKKWILIVFVVLVVFALTVAAQEETDEILDFYQKRAGEVFKSRNPLEAGVTYSFESTTYHKSFDKDYNIFIKDSTVEKYFFSFGKLDSIQIITPPKKSIDSLDFTYPNVFTGEYKYNFFPNDTGGNEISIGYDSYEYNTSLPVGIATIDRDRYFLKNLYLHIMNSKSIYRRSKAIRFIELEGYVFPDSLWELKTKRGIFSTEFYRIETGIKNIKIQR